MPLQPRHNRRKEIPLPLSPECHHDIQRTSLCLNIALLGCHSDAISVKSLKLVCLDCKVHYFIVCRC